MALVKTSIESEGGLFKVIMEVSRKILSLINTIFYCLKYLQKTTKIDVFLSSAESGVGD